MIDGTFRLGITWSKYLGLEGASDLYDGHGTTKVVRSIMNQMESEHIIDTVVMPALHLLLSLNRLISLATNASKLGNFFQYFPFQL